MSLRDSLEDLRDFLGRHGEGRWAMVIGQALAEHAGDEPALARAALGWDEAGLGRLVLSPMNGHGVQVCAIDGTNRRLAARRAGLRAAAGEVLANS